MFIALIDIFQLSVDKFTPFTDFVCRQFVSQLFSQLENKSLRFNVQEFLNIHNTL